MHVTLYQPGILTRAVDAAGERSKRAGRIANKTMAGEQIAVGRDAEVTRSRSARIRPVRALVNFLQRQQQIGKWISIPFDRAPLEFLPAINHRLKHIGKAVVRELAAAVRRIEHG